MSCSTPDRRGSGGARSRPPCAAGRGRRRPPPIVRAPRGEALPLSFAQQRLWFLEQMRAGHAGVQHPRRVPPARPARRRRAGARLSTEWCAATRSLRTAFPSRRGRPVQVVGRPAPLSASPRVDLSALPEPAARGGRACASSRPEAHRPFDLAARPAAPGPPAPPRRGGARRARSRPPHRQRRLVAGRADPRAGGPLRGVPCQGEPSPLPELPIQYADFAAWQRRWLRGEVLEDQLAYWRGRSSGAPPVLELPADRPRPARASVPRRPRGRCALPRGARGGAAGARPPRGGDALHDAARRLPGASCGITPGRTTWSSAPTSPTATALETEGLIGFFINQLVLRTDLSGDPTFARAAGAGARGRRSAPTRTRTCRSITWSRRSSLPRSLRHAPLFQVKLFVA